MLFVIKNGKKGLKYQMYLQKGQNRTMMRKQRGRNYYQGGDVQQEQEANAWENLNRISNG